MYIFRGDTENVGSRVVDTVCHQKLITTFLGLDSFKTHFTKDAFPFSGVSVLRESAQGASGELRDDEDPGVALRQVGRPREAQDGQAAPQEGDGAVPGRRRGVDRAGGYSAENRPGQRVCVWSAESTRTWTHLSVPTGQPLKLLTMKVVVMTRKLVDKMTRLKWV